MTTSQKKADKEPNRKPPKKKKRLRWGSIILLLLLVICAAGAVTVFSVVSQAMEGIPTLEEAKIDNFDVTSYIVDKDGNYVEKLHAVENRIPVTYDEISPNMVKSIIAIEDHRFTKHIGVDPIRIAGAMVANIKAGSIVQGGSTITQQLAGLAMLDRQEKTYERKIQEAVIAIQIEKRYSKEEIITNYLNRVYFGIGGNGVSVYGIEAASNDFFGKHASELTMAESAMLAGMVQNPGRWSPIANPENALKRREAVLRAMLETGILSTEEEFEALNTTPIELGVLKGGKSVTTSTANQSYVDHVFEEALTKLGLENDPKKLYTGGYVIYTGLNTDLQKYMYDFYNNDGNFPSGRNGEILQSAMVMMEPKTGVIRGLIGGRNLNVATERGFNRATQSLRQPGSTFKPIVAYAAAFNMGYGTGSVDEDYPLKSGSHVFNNYNFRYKGLTTYREAIAGSYNAMTVRTMQRIGVENGIEFAKSLGITSLVESGDYNDMNLSTALGGVTHGVTPLEMVGAYATFANAGTYIKPHAITKITDENGTIIWEGKDETHQAMSPEAAYLTTSTLQSVISNGIGGRAALAGGRSAAGKTGTTSDNKDLWFVGYTPQYAAVVWMGFDKPKEVSGSSGNCATVFRNIMNYAHQNLPAENFSRPDGVVSVTIDTKSGLLPNSLTPSEYQRSELFIKGHVPSKASTVWVQEEVCPESGQLMTEFCPGPATLKTFLKREKPWQDFQVSGYAPEDAGLEYRGTPCTLHTAETSALLTQGDFSLSGSATYTDGHATNVSLSWQALADDHNIVYEIHRGATAGFASSESTKIASGSGTSSADHLSGDGKNVYYRIMAYTKDTHQQLASSNTIRIVGTQEAAPATTEVPAPPDPTPPSTSLDLSANATGGTGAGLSWSTPGAGSYSYYIFRSESAGFSPSTANQVGYGTGTSFSESSLAPGTTYYYQVLAYNQHNELIASSGQVPVPIP